MCSADGYIETMKLVESTVGFDAVKVWHCNDAKAAMGSKPGPGMSTLAKGRLGAAAFRRLAAGCAVCALRVMRDAGGCSGE